MKESRYRAYNESTGLLFWQVAALWQRAIKSALRQFDLTPTQYVIVAVISELSESNDEVTQKQISDFSMIDPMTVSSTLRLLEKKGLTKRSQSKVDSRANAIYNTDAGSAILKRAVKTVENVDAIFFFDTENDIKSFQSLLEKLKTENQNLKNFV